MNKYNALHHVKSNRKRSGASRKNLTQNTSPKEGHNGVRHENEKEIERRNGQALLWLSLGHRVLWLDFYLSNQHPFG